MVVVGGEAKRLLPDEWVEEDKDTAAADEDEDASVEVEERTCIVGWKKEEGFKLEVVEVDIPGEFVRSKKEVGGYKFGQQGT